MRFIFLGPDGGIPAPGWRPEGVDLEDDFSVAHWVTEGLLDWRTMRTSGCLVGHVVPKGFPAYARLFHPAERPSNTSAHEPLRWSEIASRNGRVAHPLMQFHRIANLPGSLTYDASGFVYEPTVGSLPPKETADLAGPLREFTASPELCYFCIWEGWGDLDHDYYQSRPRVQVGRDCLLFRGPLNAVPFREGRQQSPTVWWPADRAWCVATEIDFMETLIGGSAACIESILNHPGLEALPVTLDAQVSSGGDAINPPTNEK